MEYVIDHAEFKSIVIHWVALYVNGNKIFDSFGAELIRKIIELIKEIKKFMGNKNIITSIYRMQAFNSVISGYFCIGFIDFMLKVCWIIQICFLLMIMRIMIKYF